MKKLLVQATTFCLLAVLSIVVLSRTTQAGGDGCVPVYGGGEQCPKAGEVLVDKKVRNGSTGLYVDNLGLSDPKYRPGQIVYFQIVVKNTGDNTLSTVSVTDKIPVFVDFMSGPGSYDANTRNLTFSTYDLRGGESRYFYVKVKVVHESVLPSEKSVVCPVNVIDATSDSQKDHDESQFCIEKQPIIPTVPKAGPEHWIMTFLGITTALSIGLFLRKKAIVN